MVNYKDHQGSYKWNIAHGDFSRNPRARRDSLRMLPMITLAGFMSIKLSQALKVLINQLPYWETRRKAKDLEKASFDTIIAANSKPLSSIRKSSVF